MLLFKKLVGSVLLVSVLMFPTSAFASKDNNSQNSYDSYNQSIINKILSFVSNGHNSQNDLKDFWDKNKDVKDWYDKNKNNQPKVESYDIWKDWYCK